VLHPLKGSVPALPPPTLPPPSPPSPALGYILWHNQQASARVKQDRQYGSMVCCHSQAVTAHSLPDEAQPLCHGRHG